MTDTADLLVVSCTALLLLLPCTASATDALSGSSDGCPRLPLLSNYDDFIHERQPAPLQPMMCVPREFVSRAAAQASYDAMTGQAYVSVPLLLRSDTEGHRSGAPAFAQLVELVAQADPESAFTVLSLVWSPDRSIADLWLGCSGGRSLTSSSTSVRGDAATSSAKNCSIGLLALKLQAGQFEALDYVTISATLLNAYGERVQRRYRPVLQDARFPTPEAQASRRLPVCHQRQLKQVRTLNLQLGGNNCSVPVHQRLDQEGFFFLEPLLCPTHSRSGVSASVKRDYAIGKYYIDAEVGLQSEAALVEARAQLADLEPRSVEFARLWRSEVSHVAAFLMQRSSAPLFTIGPLLVSRDWQSARMRVHCRDRASCWRLGREIIARPENFWRHVRWTTTLQAMTNRRVGQGVFRYEVRNCEFASLTSRSAADGVADGAAVAAPAEQGQMLAASLQLASPYVAVHRLSLPFSSPGSTPTVCWIVGGQSDEDGGQNPSPRQFVVVQQRLRGGVSFQRNWTDYEAGFGDKLDFWIGLSTMHALTSTKPGGAILRVEMMLTSGARLHVEYAGFSIGNADTGYRMTYRHMLPRRTSPELRRFDALAKSKGMRFATKDRDNPMGCSKQYGGSVGWWYKDCQRCNPNGLFSTSTVCSPSGTPCMYWRSMESSMGWLSVKQVRLLIEYQQETV